MERPLTAAEIAAAAAPQGGICIGTPRATAQVVLGSPVASAQTPAAPPLPAAASLEESLPPWPDRLIADASSHPFLLYGVFAFLPWSERAGGLCRLSKQLRQFLRPEDGRAYFWRWLCGLLRAEARLLLPDDESDLVFVAGGDGNQSGEWRALFGELWPLRHQFLAAVHGQGKASSICAVPGVSDAGRLAASCRMRPGDTGPPPEGATAEADASVSLPLHQRVALLRQARPELTRKEAMLLVMKKGSDDEEEGVTLVLEKKTAPEEGNREPSPENRDSAEDAPAEASGEEGGAEAVEEVEEAELGDGAATQAESGGFTASILSVTPGPCGSVLTVSPGIGIRNWEFDHVFGETVPQCDLYRRCGLRFAARLLNGVNGALIVYGQTGSGKTHTMFGPHRDALTMNAAEAGGSSASEEGLVPRVAAHVLQGAAQRREAGFEVMLGASYVEVFGNDVSNLLGGPIGRNRGANQRLGHCYVLEGQCEEPVPDLEAFETILRRGEENKRRASTAMNARSSRAHVMVILRLRQRAPDQERFVESTLFLVDLGGSERVSKSHANEKVRAPGAVNVGGGEVLRVSWQEYYACRERITETVHINKGLLTLKRCVQAINERQECLQAGRPAPRVPFHDSKLTMLLQPALSGEACTSIIVCASPESRHAEETVQSLRFGELCSRVEQRRGGQAPDVGEAIAQAVERIDVELKELEANIRSKERWEWRATQRAHVVDEKDTGGTVCHKDEVMELGLKGAVEIRADDGTSAKNTVEHTVWGQVLVGAEAENARRDALLLQRQKLLGQE